MSWRGGPTIVFALFASLASIIETYNMSRVEGEDLPQSPEREKSVFFNVSRLSACAGFYVRHIEQIERLQK